LLSPGFLDDPAMRERATDVVVPRRFDGGETADLALDSQPSESPLHVLPSIRPAVEVDAIDGVEEMKGTGQLGPNRLNHGLGRFFAGSSRISSVMFRASVVNRSLCVPSSFFFLC
jgi:hypothetical protein